MIYQPTISYLEALDNDVKFKKTNTWNLKDQCLIGGHVEFSVRDETYEHFFTSPEELREMAHYMQTGKLLAGLRQFIARNYIPGEPAGGKPVDEQIIIWNYEFDLSLERQ